MTFTAAEKEAQELTDEYIKLVDEVDCRQGKRGYDGLN